MGYGFQTPGDVADTMMRIAGFTPRTVLEPSSGIGNLVVAAKIAFPDADITSVELDADYCREQRQRGFVVTCADFFSFDDPDTKYDLVVANPPHSPMLVGYEMMERLAVFSCRIIAIMPWLWMINSQSRHEKWRPHLRSVTQLPRSTFPGARIQTAIFDVDLSRKFGFTRYK